MRLLQIFSLVLSLTLTALAGTAAPRYHLSSTSFKSIKSIQALGLSIKDFLISDISTKSIALPATNSSGPALNTTISFVFADPNVNTSTFCTDTFTQTNTSSTAPLSYILCNRTNFTEFFQWKFTSYDGLDKFQIMFTHFVSDPAVSPPPFDEIAFFSAATNFTLECENATGTGQAGCKLPRRKSPVHAPINGISG